MADTNDTQFKSRLSRRHFLAAVGVGAAGSTLAAVAPLGAHEVDARGGWDIVTDVIVAGSGGAACAAAIYAAADGAKVVLLEKASAFGGTTAKSGGVIFIPNNALMQADGIEDPREDALRYLARGAYPELYSPEGPTLGLGEREYSLLEAFYDEGSGIISGLQEMGAVTYGYWRSVEGDIFPDYYGEFAENRVLRGRGLAPVQESGAPGNGDYLIASLMADIERRGVDARTNHRVSKLIQGENGEIIGVEAIDSSDGQETTLLIGARRGVIFGTGDFTHNRALVNNFLPGVIYGGCNVPSNEGDLVTMATGIGVPVANMKNAAWKQVVLEEALEFGVTGAGASSLGGDSMVLVNRDGVRVVNEKLNYNQRSRVHFDWEANTSSYKNQFLFMIYDARVREVFGGAGAPIPRPDVIAPAVISGETLDELMGAINERLASHEPQIPQFRLSESFAANLGETIERFNGFAETGVDDDFGRGTTGAHELAFHGRARDGNDKPNRTMYPISGTGPYYAVILAAGTFGTRGGPMIDSNGQVLDQSGNPIDGLYGAGNCVAGPSGAAYWSGGSAIGPGMVMGGIAGRHVAQQPDRSI